MIIKIIYYTTILYCSINHLLRCWFWLETNDLTSASTHVVCDQCINSCILHATYINCIFTRGTVLFSHMFSSWSANMSSTLPLRRFVLHVRYSFCVLIISSFSNLNRIDAVRNANLKLVVFMCFSEKQSPVRAREKTRRPQENRFWNHMQCVFYISPSQFGWMSKRVRDTLLLFWNRLNFFFFDSKSIINMENLTRPW